MGKAKKLKLSSQRHAPLGDQIQKDDFAAPSSRPSKDGLGRRRKTRTGEEDVDQFVDGKLSGRILSQAREQVQELEAEELSTVRPTTGQKPPNLSSSTVAINSDDESEPEDDFDADSIGNGGGFDGHG